MTFNDTENIYVIDSNGNITSSTPSNLIVTLGKGPEIGERKIINISITRKNGKMTYHQYVENYLNGKSESELEEILLKCYGKTSIEEVFHSTKEEFIQEAEKYYQEDAYKNGLKMYIESISSSINYIQIDYVMYDLELENMTDEELSDLFLEMTGEDLDSSWEENKSEYEPFNYNKKRLVGAQYLYSEHLHEYIGQVNGDSNDIDTEITMTLLKDGNPVQRMENYKLGKFFWETQYPVEEDGEYTVIVKDSEGNEVEESITIE